MGTKTKHVGGVAIILGLVGGGCMGVDEISYDETLANTADQGELEQGQQPGKTVVDGLMSVNGLTVTNGMKSVNGLTATNGMKTVNGFLTVNGITTVNGLSTVNGVYVNCYGKTEGTTSGKCSGKPDGLFSRTTGLMKSSAGVNTATYVVKCALSSSQYVKVKKWDGTFVTLRGSLGLSTGWSTGQCDKVCQEKISACLLAHTNGLGANIPIELSSTVSAIGTGHSSSYPYQEGAYYGNLFLEPPKAFIALGRDYQTAASDDEGIKRACAAHAPMTAEAKCPIKYQSMVTHTITYGDGSNWTTIGRCQQTALDSTGDGTVTRCTDKDGVVWANPITVWRQTPANTISVSYEYRYNWD